MVVAGRTGSEISDATLEMVGKARELANAWGGAVEVVMLGSSAGSDKLAGADTALLVEHPALEQYATEAYEVTLKALLADRAPGCCWCPTTRWGWTSAPRWPLRGTPRWPRRSWAWRPTGTPRSRPARSSAARSSPTSRSAPRVECARWSRGRSSGLRVGARGGLRRRARGARVGPDHVARADRA
ncbi:MAG: hypothetical protein R2734_08465 [Nocardioides sp.]